MLGITFKLLVAFSGGIAAALQATLASVMGQRVGSMASVFVVHIGGTLLAGALLLGQGGGNIAQWRTVPWYALGAGTLAARGESHTATRADLFRHLCVAEPPEYSRYSGVSAP